MSNIEFTDNSGKVLSELEKAKENALTAIGMVAEGHAKRKTPVDTGRLRNSITFAVKEESVFIGTNVEYAPFVELGSRTNKAHHMLQDAAGNHGAEYKAIAKAALEGTDL